MIWVWLVVAATVELEVRMVHIDWRRLPDRPLGTQDSAAGIIDDDFVIIAGNRGRQGTPAHAGQAGMYTGGQSLSISNPQLGWSNVTSVPATTADGKRLGFSTGSTASIPLPNGMGSGLAFAGGFSHTNCSRQVFVMMKTVAPAYGKFGYERLPDLPWDIAEANLVAVGSTLYSIGGADCGLPPNTERFLTWSDRWGGNKGFGTRVLSLDLSKCPLWRVDLDSDSDGANAKFDCQWAREADFPGSPRSGATVVAVSGTVYVLGGYSSANTSICAKPPQDCTTIMQPGCLSSPVDKCVFTTHLSYAWLDDTANRHVHGCAQLEDGHDFNANKMEPVASTTSCRHTPCRRYKRLRTVAWTIHPLDWRHWTKSCVDIPRLAIPPDCERQLATQREAQRHVLATTQRLGQQ